MLANALSSRLSLGLEGGAPGRGWCRLVAAAPAETQEQGSLQPAGPGQAERGRERRGQSQSGWPVTRGKVNRLGHGADGWKGH